MSIFRFAALATLGLLLGCAGRPALIPNSDKNLNKTSAELAADAAKRHPYKTDAARGGEAIGRAQVGYSLDRLEVVNLGPEPWGNVELWVNKSYVVFLPVMQPKKLKIINFQMLYDDKGHSFPTDNKKILINKVEVLTGGKMFDVPLKLAD